MLHPETKRELEKLGFYFEASDQPDTIVVGHENMHCVSAYRDDRPMSQDIRILDTDAFVDLANGKSYDWDADDPEGWIVAFTLIYNSQKD